MFFLKRKKRFEDEELVKKAMLSAVESPFEGFGNNAETVSLIENVQLSVNAIKSR
jgi:hypothetical protein